MNLSKAIQFVQENGTILEKARLLRLLLEVEPSREAYQKLLDSQNPDGGFPSRPKPGSQSALDSTLTALWQLDELGLMALPAAERAAGFLLAMQRPDGGWDENPNLLPHDLPPWIQPGQLSTRLYLSTYAVYWLALRGQSGGAAFQRGVGYIAAQQEPSGKIPGYLHNNWLGAAAFLLSGQSYAENAARVIQWMETGGFGEWDDSQVSWAVDCLTRAGLPADHSFLRAGLEALDQRQAEDGSWASEDGPAFAASATVGVLKVLKIHGRVEEF